MTLVSIPRNVAIEGSNKSDNGLSTGLALSEVTRVEEYDHTTQVALQNHGALVDVLQGGALKLTT